MLTTCETIRRDRRISAATDDSTALVRQDSTGVGGTPPDSNGRLTKSVSGAADGEKGGRDCLARPSDDRTTAPNRPRLAVPLEPLARFESHLLRGRMTSDVTPPCAPRGD